MRNVLIIGAGLIGKKRAANLPESMKLFGFFDIDLEKVDLAAKEFSTNSYFNLVDALENLSENSLVIVSTQHKDLAVIAEQALSRKMHVLVEKPGAINSEEMRNLLQIASENKVTISIGYNHRFHGAAVKLKELTEAKVYGPIQLIRARYGHGGRLGYEKEWRADEELSGGGELLDQGCHLIDLLQYCGGTPELEFSMLPTLYWDMNVEDNAFLAGSIGQNAKFWIHASWTEWKNLFSFEVFYKKAKIEWSGLNGSYGPEKLTVYHMENGLGLPKMHEFNFEGTDDSWKLELIEIEKRINNEQSRSSSGVEGLRTLELIARAYAS